MPLHPPYTYSMHLPYGRMDERGQKKALVVMDHAGHNEFWKCLMASLVAFLSFSTYHLGSKTHLSTLFWQFCIRVAFCKLSYKTKCNTFPIYIRRYNERAICLRVLSHLYYVCYKLSLFQYSPLYRSKKQALLIQCLHPSLSCVVGPLWHECLARRRAGQDGRQLARGCRVRVAQEQHGADAA